MTSFDIPARAPAMRRKCVAASATAVTGGGRALTLAWPTLCGFFLPRVGHSSAKLTRRVPRVGLFYLGFLFLLPKLRTAFSCRGSSRAFTFQPSIEEPGLAGTVDRRSRPCRERRFRPGRNCEPLWGLSLIPFPISTFQFQFQRGDAASSYQVLQAPFLFNFQLLTSLAASFSSPFSNFYFLISIL